MALRQRGGGTGLRAGGPCLARRRGVLSFGGTKNGMQFGETVVFFDAALAEEFGRKRMQGSQLASCASLPRRG
jgi:hypothetical protein